MLGGIAKNGDYEYAHKDVAETELVSGWLNGADQDLTQPCDRDSGSGEHRDRLPKRPGIRMCDVLSRVDAPERVRVSPKREQEERGIDCEQHQRNRNAESLSSARINLSHQ